MITVGSFSEVRKLATGRVGLVPTMGYLHEGHLGLVATARGECDTVVVSSFVNPLQFADGEDLTTYPRNPGRDATLAEEAGTDILFAPEPDTMYGVEPATEVSVPALSRTMEGERRPAHFPGVALAVVKLFVGLRPDRAYFGRKDAQQLAIVRRLAADLSFDVDVIGCSTVRESDGLALSSRNTYLSPEERNAALKVYHGLEAAADAVEDGERTAATLELIALAPVAVHSGIFPDYAVLAAQDDVESLTMLDRPAFLAVAAHVGKTRMIDNIHIDWIDGDPVPDRGVCIDKPSILYEEV